MNLSRENVCPFGSRLYQSNLIDFHHIRQDALCLQCGLSLKNSPSLCNCSQPFTTEYFGGLSNQGFPSMKWNGIHNITSSFLSEVCHNVATEPSQQHLSGKQMDYNTASTTPYARLPTLYRKYGVERWLVCEIFFGCMSIL